MVKSKCLSPTTPNPFSRINLFQFFSTNIIFSSSSGFYLKSPPFEISLLCQVSSSHLINFTLWLHCRDSSPHFLRGSLSPRVPLSSALGLSCSSRMSLAKQPLFKDMHLLIKNFILAAHKRKFLFILHK